MKTPILLLAASISLTLFSNGVEARKGGGLSSLLGVARAVNRNENKIYNSHTLTVEQLSNCLKKDKELEISDNRISHIESHLSVKDRALSKLNAELDSIDSYIKRHQGIKFLSQERVNYFNSKVDEFNRLLSEYNDNLVEFKKIKKDHNTYVSEHNRLVLSLNITCSNRSYYEEDMAEAKRLLE